MSPSVVVLHAEQRVWLQQLGHEGVMLTLWAPSPHWQQYQYQDMFFGGWLGGWEYCFV